MFGTLRMASADMAEAVDNALVGEDLICRDEIAPNRGHLHAGLPHQAHGREEMAADRIMISTTNLAIPTLTRFRTTAGIFDLIANY